jgi:nicotinate-nucleotide adenylyltransferase
LVAAETTRVELGLDYVLFIPTGESPHKDYFRITDAQLRFQMVEISVGNNPYFEASGIEIQRKGPSYTADTLRELHAVFPDQELYFITGTDAMMDIPKWHETEEIFKLASVVGVSRPGYEGSGLLQKIIETYPASKNKVFQLEIPALAISSTYIRNRVADNKSIRYLLPEQVREFIDSHNLYRSQKTE